jgi:hypothetical protein
MYILHGELSRAARECGIPKQTAHRWMNKAWWPRLVDVVRIRHKEELEAKFENILDKSADQLIDRIHNGDVIPHKGGLIRVPVKAKELAQVIDATHANLRTSRNQPNNISVSATMDLRQLASNFARAGRTYQKELHGYTPLPAPVDVVPDEEASDPELMDPDELDDLDAEETEDDNSAENTAR